MVKKVVQCAALAVLCMALCACEDAAPAPVTANQAFSTSSSDYLYKGGKGSTWEYRYTSTFVDSNGKLTKGKNDGTTVRYTLLDTGVTRRNVSNITLMVAHKLRDGSVFDIDTLYYTNHTGQIVGHQLPLENTVKWTVLADPIANGASFRFNDIDQNGPFLIQDVDVRTQTEAGLFRSITLYQVGYTVTYENGDVRTMTNTMTMAPWNLYLKTTNVKTRTFASGKTEVETWSMDIIRIDRKD